MFTCLISADIEIQNGVFFEGQLRIYPIKVGVFLFLCKSVMLIIQRSSLRCIKNIVFSFILFRCVLRIIPLDFALKDLVYNQIINYIFL